MTEIPVRFACGDDWLQGVIHAPGTPSRVGLLIVVGGPQYRAGSHRQFTLLARRCATQTHIAAMRFDVRGMGDSTGAKREFESLDDDIQAAIDELQRHYPELRQVVLWGLCDGASASLLYVNRRSDPRVAGLVLLNPWVRTPQGLARTHAKHYYRQRLRQPDFWRKLLTGGVRWGAMSEWLHNRRLARQRPITKSAAHFSSQMAAAMRSFAGPRLLILSGEDFTAREFIEHTAASAEWQGCLERSGLTRVDLPTANHTFSAPADTFAVEQATCDWLSSALAHRDVPAVRCQESHQS